MKLKRLIFFAAVLLSVLSCYADNGDHGFPKAWEKWRAELEKDSGKVVAYSVKRDWVLYVKRQSEYESCLVRSMRKNKDWDFGIMNPPDYLASFNLLPVNIDTCKTNFVIESGAAGVLQTVSRDGRAIFIETSEYRKEISYHSLETGKSKVLSDTYAWHALEGVGEMTGFDSDSTFYTWEMKFCDKKGNVISDEKVVQASDRMNYKDGPWRARLSIFLDRGNLYKDYYRKVRYNTKGEKLRDGKLVRVRKMMEEYWSNSNETSSLEGWELKLYDAYGREVAESTTWADGWWIKRDSLINQGDYTYYYQRKDGWGDADVSKRYTKAAVLFLEKQKWGIHNEIPQDGIYDGETTYYRWMPILCDAQGRVVGDAAIYPADVEVVDVKDAEEALRAGKMQYLYRRMWYDDKNSQYDYMGCDAKLYTKDEVAAIEKNRFRWPDEWPAK